MEEKKVVVETKELSETEKEYIESWMTHNPQISAFRFFPNNQIEVTASGNMKKIMDAIEIPLIITLTTIALHVGSVAIILKRKKTII